LGSDACVCDGRRARGNDAGVPRCAQKARTLVCVPLRIATKTDLEPRLVLGAALFGIGWGLAGLCPGPAVTDLVTARGSVLLFVAAMLAGAMFYDWLDARIKS